MNRFRPDPAVWSGNVTHDGLPNVASTFGNKIIPAWTWDRPAEAAHAALGAGASAILVSNHGAGRRPRHRVAEPGHGDEGVT